MDIFENVISKQGEKYVFKRRTISDNFGSEFHIALFEMKCTLYHVIKEEKGQN